MHFNLLTLTVVVMATNFCFSKVENEHYKQHCSINKSPTDYIADCSHRSLSEIPSDLPKNITILNLSNNLIRKLVSDGFHHFKDLHYLDLSWNTISTIEQGSFNNLSRLRYLDISNNVLENSAIDEDTFVPIANLKVLRMQKLNLCEYPDKSLGKLLNLESLTIDGLDNKTFGKGFEKLTKLNYLSMSGWETACNLTKLSKQNFVYLPYLRYLNISNCSISSLEEDVFSPLKHIFLLNISDNNDGGMKMLRNICQSLQNTTIEVLIMDRVETKLGVGIFIDRSDVEFCRGVPIKILSVNNNRLEYMEWQTAIRLPKSTEIVYSIDNRFSKGVYEFGVIFFPCLKKVYADSTIGKKQFSLDVHFPPLTIEQRDIQKEINELDKRNDSSSSNCTEHFLIHPKACVSFWENITSATIDTLTCILPKSLQEVYATNLKLNRVVKEFNFPTGNTITRINLTGNTLYEWQGPIRYLDSLTILDLSVNFCYKVGEEFFKYMPSLEWLNLRMNFLGYSLKNDISGSIFGNLNKLKVLNLHLNRITHLPSKCFRGLNNLEVLDLSDNSLSEMSVDISHMENLSYIDLSNNGLEFLPKSAREHLDKNALHRNVTINLHQNELKCVCNNLEFLRWIKHSEVKFENINNYSCIDEKLRSKNLTNIDDILQNLEKDCADWTTIIAGCSATISVLIVVLISAQLYQKRWKLRYIYYMTLGRYTLLHEETVNSTYKYDAFISYDNENEDFVRNKMIPQLEEMSSLLLCIHQRDFTPGNAIAANIVDAIRASRKTVVVLSRDYLESKWCMFEFNMARMESMFTRGGEPVLFLIVLESLGPREMPLEMLEVMQKQSYIEYPNDEQGDVIFWHRVQQKLQIRGQRET